MTSFVIVMVAVCALAHAHALDRQSTLSIELSKRLSKSAHGPQPIELPGESSPKGGLRPGESLCVVSYIPGDNLARCRQRSLGAFEKSSEDLAPGESLGAKLDFDPALVVEFSSSPVTDQSGNVVVPGSLWLDGKNAKRLDTEGENRGTNTGTGSATSTSGNSALRMPTLLVQVVDCPGQVVPQSSSCPSRPSSSRQTRRADACQQQTWARCSLVQCVRPRSARSVRSGSSHLQSASLKPQRAEPTCGSSARSQTSVSCQGPAVDMPGQERRIIPPVSSSPVASATCLREERLSLTPSDSLIDPSSYCGPLVARPPSVRRTHPASGGGRWGKVSLGEKRRLVRGAVPCPGEVSALISEVQCRGGTARRLHSRSQ